MVQVLKVIKRWFREVPTLDMFVDTVEYLLHFIGIGITEATVEMTTRRHMLLLVCTLPMCVTHVVGTLYYYAVVLQPCGDALGTVRAVLILLSALIAIINSLWIALYRQEICCAIKDARALGPALLTTWTWRLGTLIVSGFVGIGCQRLLMPLVQLQRLLPEDIRLPGLENIKGTPDYELTYLMHAFAIITMLPSTISFYVLFIGLTDHLSVHFRLLSASFLSLVERSAVQQVSSSSTKPDRGSLDHKELSNNMSELIQQHCKLIAVTNRVKHLFNTILGVDFGIVTLSLGLLLVQINKLGILNLIDFVTYLFGTLFIICLTGESMCTAAEGLSTSVWCSGWEQFRANDSRSVLIVLRLSQRPQVLIAASFVMITYQSLMVVLKTCFSIYTTFSAVQI